MQRKFYIFVVLAVMFIGLSFFLRDPIQTQYWLKELPTSIRIYNGITGFEVELFESDSIRKDVLDHLSSIELLKVVDEEIVGGGVGVRLYYGEEFIDYFFANEEYVYINFNDSEIIEYKFRDQGSLSIYRRIEIFTNTQKQNK